MDWFQMSFPINFSSLLKNTKGEEGQINERPNVYAWIFNAIIDIQTEMWNNSLIKNMAHKGKGKCRKFSWSAHNPFQTVSTNKIIESSPQLLPRGIWTEIWKQSKISSKDINIIPETITGALQGAILGNPWVNTAPVAVKNPLLRQILKYINCCYIPQIPL
jgi:hypothetical protein